MKALQQQDKLFIFAAVGVALASWEFGFNLAAFETIFFEHLFAVWVASSAVLIACCMLPSERRPLGWLGMLALFSPTLWVISLIASYANNGDWAWLSFLIGSGVALICLPYVGYVLIAVMQTDAQRLNQKRHLLGLVLIATLSGGAGFVVGGQHYFLLTCEDFKRSGSFVPENCWPAGK